MAAPPDGNVDIINVSALKADIHRALGNVLSGQKRRTRVKPKRGSKRYLHLQKFIETRRQKKLRKRSTLDLSAQVSLLIENIITMMMMLVMIMKAIAMPTFDITSSCLFQPVDVSHIYVPDLHERQQKRLPKKNNMTRGSEVRSANRSLLHFYFQ